MKASGIDAVRQDMKARQWHGLGRLVLRSVEGNQILPSIFGVENTVIDKGERLQPIRVCESSFNRRV
jgi:hypothetical protein